MCVHNTEAGLPITAGNTAICVPRAFLNQDQPTSVSTLGTSITKGMHGTPAVAHNVSVKMLYMATTDVLIRKSSFGIHYENMPMQYTDIEHFFIYLMLLFKTLIMGTRYNCLGERRL